MMGHCSGLLPSIPPPIVLAWRVFPASSATNWMTKVRPGVGRALQSNHEQSRRPVRWDGGHQ